MDRHSRYPRTDDSDGLNRLTRMAAICVCVCARACVRACVCVCACVCPVSPPSVCLPGTSGVRPSHGVVTSVGPGIWSGRVRPGGTHKHTLCVCARKKHTLCVRVRAKSIPFVRVCAQKAYLLCACVRAKAYPFCACVRAKSIPFVCVCVPGLRARWRTCACGTPRTTGSLGRRGRPP